MNCAKTGALIRRLRLEHGMTQQKLADRLGISPKTVSKWECGLGCPDVSLLSALSAALGVQAEVLLSGGLGENTFVPGNMKQTRFFVCPTCGSITASAGNARVSCCGKALPPLEGKKAAPEEKLRLEQVEDEWFITSDHPMRKDCYVSFLAFVTGDSVHIVKLYPEWEMQVRLPRKRHGTLYYYSTEHRLFYQYI